MNLMSEASRRRFLKSAAGGLVAAASTSAPSVLASDDQAVAIDAHTHFYDPTRPEGVPWPPKSDLVLYRPVLPAEFQKLTRNKHVSGTIVIEASSWPEDNQWLLDLAAREPFIKGVVGRLDTSDDQFAARLQRFTRNRVFRGIRINHDELKSSIEHKSQLERISLLAKSDIELDVNGGPDMPTDVARLARLLPDLRLVINHAANLTIDGRPPPEAWITGIRSAAANGNVFCKVSALVEGTHKMNRDAPADPAFYAPVLDALWNLFGEDRLIFGSNWPVSERAAPYATVYQIVHNYFDQKGKPALEKFLRTNAINAYKLV